MAATDNNLSSIDLQSGNGLDDRRYTSTPAAIENTTFYPDHYSFEPSQHTTFYSDYYKFDSSRPTVEPGEYFKEPSLGFNVYGETIDGIDYFGLYATPPSSPPIDLESSGTTVFPPAQFHAPAACTNTTPPLSPKFVQDYRNTQIPGFSFVAQDGYDPKTGRKKRTGTVHPMPEKGKTMGNLGLNARSHTSVLSIQPSTSEVLPSSLVPFTVEPMSQSNQPDYPRDIRADHLATLTACHLFPHLNHYSKDNWEHTIPVKTTSPTKLEFQSLVFAPTLEKSVRPTTSGSRDAHSTLPGQPWKGAHLTSEQSIPISAFRKRYHPSDATLETKLYSYRPRNLGSQVKVTHMPLPPPKKRRSLGRPPKIMALNKSQPWSHTLCLSDLVCSLQFPDKVCCSFCYHSLHSRNQTGEICMPCAASQSQCTGERPNCQHCSSMNQSCAWMKEEEYPESLAAEPSINAHSSCVHCVHIITGLRGLVEETSRTFTHNTAVVRGQVGMRGGELRDSEANDSISGKNVSHTAAKYWKKKDRKHRERVDSAIRMANNAGNRHPAQPIRRRKQLSSDGLAQAFGGLVMQEEQSSRKIEYASFKGDKVEDISSKEQNCCPQPRPRFVPPPVHHHHHYHHRRAKPRHWDCYRPNKQPDNHRHRVTRNSNESRPWHAGHNRARSQRGPRTAEKKDFGSNAPLPRMSPQPALKSENPVELFPHLMLRGPNSGRLPRRGHRFRNRRSI